MIKNIKYRHFRFLKSKRVFTIATRLDKENQMLYVGYSIYNPNDTEQWEKKIGSYLARKTLEEEPIVIDYSTTIFSEPSYELICAIAIKGIYFTYVKNPYAKQAVLNDLILIEDYCLDIAFKKMQVTLEQYKKFLKHIVF